LYLNFQEMSQLRIAAIYVFGPHLALREDFWPQLTRESLKQAFRKQARRYHPDLQHSLNPDLVRQKQERFIRVREAYETLQNFLSRHGGVIPWKAGRRSAKAGSETVNRRNSARQTPTWFWKGERNNRV
jgi:curved DNA-binding protein CbpA